MGLFFEMAGSIGGRTVGCVLLQGHLRELRSVELFRHREDRGRLPGTRRAVQQQVRQPVLAGEPADGIDDVLVSRDVGELGRPVFLHQHYVLLRVIHGAHLLLLAGVDAGGVHFHRRHVPLSRSYLGSADLSPPLFLGCPAMCSGRYPVWFGYRYGGVARCAELASADREPGRRNAWLLASPVCAI